MENNTNHRRDLGKSGEDIACEWLRRHGHTVIERNYRCGHLEIDIITSDAAGIHFVEVKARKFTIQAPPQDSVTPAKQRNIIAAAGKFLNSAKGLAFNGKECSFDVFAVTFGSSGITTEWIPEAYIPVYL